MRTTISAFYIAIALGAAGRAGAQTSVLTHVNVVDISTGRIDRDQDVVIEGASILSVSPSVKRTGSMQTDFTGGYVIPGLWDMTAHLSGISRSSLALLLASGVVGLRDVDADTSLKAALRDSIEAGLVTGPHLILAGAAPRARAGPVVREAMMWGDAGDNLRYEPLPARETMLEQLMRLVRSGVSLTPTPLLLRADEKLRANLRLIAETGVILLAGSDAGSAVLPAGYSLSDHLIDMVVYAGLTPLQSLQTATTNVARSLGFSDRYGSVSAGHAADFVILDRNPLDNIANLKDVRGVVRAGKIYDRIALDSLVVTQSR